MDARRIEELSERYGLRNVIPGFLRQTSHFALENMVSPLASRDISELCTGTIPFAVDKAHAVTLGCYCLVQVEDVINIASEDPRSRSNPCTLLFRLSDGRQSFGAIEYVSFGGRLSVKTTPGAKLCLRNDTVVRRGRVLLAPSTTELVGWTNATGNVWGSQYEAKVTQALLEAGLRPPGVASFDSLASNATPITSLGGIADLADDEDNPDSGQDDEFWLQALAAEPSAAVQPLDVSRENSSG